MTSEVASWPSSISVGDHTNISVSDDSTAVQSNLVATRPTTAIASKKQLPSSFVTAPMPSPFLDPPSVGSFLAEESSLARLQRRHKQTVEREQDSEEDEALEDAFLRGMGGMTGVGSDIGRRGSMGNGSDGLRLNRRMLGVLTEEFFGCLRATEREMENEDAKKESAHSILHKRQSEERQQAVAAQQQSGGTGSERASSEASYAQATADVRFKPGPLTRALELRQKAAEALELKKAAFKNKISTKPALAATRSSSDGVVEDEDDDTNEKQGLTKSRIKKTEVDDESLHHRLIMPDCIVPPTITYLKGQAIAWYFSSTQDNSVKRKHTRNLAPEKIIECMNAISLKTPWQSERPIEVVAVFYHSEAHLAPIIMNREKMEAFVRTEATNLRPTGVLQKFVPPAAEYNSLIRVTWSPSMTLVERRTSGYKLDARRIRLEDRVHTYEVATGLGVEVREEIVHETSNLRRVIHQTCNQIAEHLSIVHGQTIAAQQSRLSMLNSVSHNHGCRPVKMTLYFKLAGKQQLYLLLCDEMKWSKLDMDEVELEWQGGNVIPLGTEKQAVYDSQKESGSLAHALSTHGHGSFAARAGIRLNSTARDYDSGDDTPSGTRGHRRSRPHSAAYHHHHHHHHGQLPQVKLFKDANQLTDGMDYFVAKRHAIADHTRAMLAAHHRHASPSPTRNNQTTNTSDNSPAGIAAPNNGGLPFPTSVQKSSAVTSTIGKKRGELRCGHCAQQLTLQNSGAGDLFNSHSASTSVAVFHNPLALSSGSKPFLDLKSILMYRLSLCAYLLPPAAVKRLDRPAAILASQKIYAEFLWNLVRPVLLPYYLVDEKEFQIHLFFQSEHEREYNVTSSGTPLPRTNNNTPAIPPSRTNTPGFDSTQPIDAVAAATASENGDGEGTVGGSSSPSKSAATGTGISSPLWDMRIYSCRSCVHLIRNWKKQQLAAEAALKAQQAREAAAAAAAAVASVAASSTASPAKDKEKGENESGKGLYVDTNIANLDPKYGGLSNSIMTPNNSNAKNSGLKLSLAPPSAAQTYEALHKLFDLLVESYLEHKKLLPPTPIDLILQPNNRTGIPASLSAVPASPAAGTYVALNGGGFLRSPNPYMVEQTISQHEKQEALKQKVLQQQQEGLLEQDGSNAEALGWDNPISPLFRLSTKRAGMQSVISSSAASAGSPYGVNTFAQSQAALARARAADEAAAEAEANLDPHTLSAADRIRHAFHQEALALTHGQLQAYAHDHLSPIEKYEAEVAEMDAPPPNKRDRELARLQRLHERAVRKARIEEAEKAAAERAQQRKENTFKHVSGKLYEPVNEIHKLDEKRRRKEARREQRVLQAIEALEALEVMDRTNTNTNNLSGEESKQDGSLLADHEAILRKLAGLDPVRAKVLKERAAAVDAEEQKRRQQQQRQRSRSRGRKSIETGAPVGMSASSDSDAGHDELTFDEAERVRAHLRRWYKTQAVKEASSFMRVAELDEKSLKSIPAFDTRSPSPPRGAVRATQFDEPSPTVPTHKAKFKSYRGGPIFISSGERMDVKEGLGFSGGKDPNFKRDSERLRDKRDRELEVRANSPVGERQGHNRRPSSTASISLSPARAQSAGLTRAQSEKMLQQEAARITRDRVRSALTRSINPSASTESLPTATAVSSFASTMVAPTRVSSAASIRPSTAASRRNDGSIAANTLSRNTSRHDLERASLAEWGYNNAGAFLSKSSPYQHEAEIARELQGFIPAGWDPIARDSYSTTFGSNNSIGGASKIHKQVKKKKKTAVENRIYQHHTSHAAQVDLTPVESPKLASMPEATPPKSLALFASASSVGLNETNPLPQADSPAKMSGINPITMEPVSNAGYLSGNRSAASTAHTPAMTMEEKRAARLSRISAADRRDEADEYDIDDAPIFEDSDEEEHRSGRAAGKGMKQISSARRKELFQEPSDELLAKAEALLFKHATEIQKQLR